MRCEDSHLLTGKIMSETVPSSAACFSFRKLTVCEAVWLTEALLFKFVSKWRRYCIFYSDDKKKTRGY